MQNPQYQQQPAPKKAGLSTPLIILIVVLSSCALCGLLGAIGSLFQKDKPASIVQTNANASEAATPVAMPTVAKTVVATTPAPTKTTGVTLENFNKIQTGMSYRQVVAILGEEGTVMSENEIAGYRTVLYQWKGGVLANMNATFQNDKLVSKAQFGLQDRLK